MELFLSCLAGCSYFSCTGRPSRFWSDLYFMVLEVQVLAKHRSEPELACLPSFTAVRGVMGAPGRARNAQRVARGANYRSNGRANTIEPS